MGTGTTADDRIKLTKTRLIKPQGVNRKFNKAYVAKGEAPVG